MPIALFPANCTVTCRYDTTLPIQLLTDGPGPKKFDARVVKTAAATMLVYRSGSCVCVGAKDPQVAISQFPQLSQIIADRLSTSPNCPPRVLARVMGKLEPKDVKVRNLVFHGQLPATEDKRLDLARLGIEINGQEGGDLLVDYSPELYPVLRVKRRSGGSGTLLVFNSRKLIITGVRHIDEATKLLQLAGFY